MRFARGRMKPDALAAAGAVAGLSLAAVTQYLSASRGVDAVVLAGYVVAALVFALTGSRAVEAARAAEWRLPRGRTAVLAAAGGVLAVVLGVAAHRAVYHSLEVGSASVLGPVLWAASLFVLLATAIVTRPLPTWPATWNGEPWPAARSRRRALVVSIGVLLLLGAAARLVALDNVPLGINTDESDRAASAISLLTGEANRNLFASGWFNISNLYFWLLAGVMKVLGVGYVQARVLGAVSGCLTLAVVVWIAFRHFGHRAALLTAVLGATLGVMLQFSREPTEAAAAALLWALSVALLLEAARTGGTWPWVAAGIAGALSLYFYPSGRLWLVLAAAAGAYLVLVAGRGRRRATLAGVGATALGALLALGPFFAHARRYPDEVFLRARQVSAFYDDNASQLGYYDPEWNTLQLLWAQVKHSVAIFASTGDNGGFWETDRPILGPVLTVLLAVGLGWFTLSVRQPRRFVVALWFWVGFAGMVGTVETPNLQQMATAVPVIPLVAAAVLDGAAGRVRRWTRRVVPEWDAGGLVVGAAVVLVAVGLAIVQARFYFGAYAGMDRWPQPTVQGQAVADQRGALVMTMGREWDKIESSWVRLLAPRVDRASVRSPGLLPLALPAARDLAFVLYPDQSAYLSLLRRVYPGGTVKEYRHPTEGLVVTVYRVPRARVAARQGAILVTPDGSAIRVHGLGALPSGMRPSAPLRWSALVLVPQYWNYSLRVGPGPARLAIGRKTVMSVPAGRTATVTLALARGRHLVTLDAAIHRGRGLTVAWKVPPDSRSWAPAGFEDWREISNADLLAARVPRGLLATVTGGGNATELRLDSTLATCCLTDEVRAREPYAVHWTGKLKVPRPGTYLLLLLTQGRATLELDGRRVIRTAPSTDAIGVVQVRLRSGRHSVALSYRVSGGGGIEWRWIPPGGEQTIVPPSALEPPVGAGVGSPVPAATLTAEGGQPADVPLSVRR